MFLIYGSDVTSGFCSFSLHLCISHLKPLHDHFPPPPPIRALADTLHVGSPVDGEFAGCHGLYIPYWGNKQGSHSLVICMSTLFVLNHLIVHNLWCVFTITIHNCRYLVSLSRNNFYSLLENVHLDLDRTDFHFWFHNDFDRQLAPTWIVSGFCAPLISQINSFFIVWSHCMQSWKWSNWIGWNNFSSAQIICVINTTVTVVCCVSLSIYPEVSMKLLLQ